MVYVLTSLTLFVVSFSKPIPSEQRCNQINKCYNPITKQCDHLAPCPKMDYCLSAQCPAYPDAQCRFNGCGACNTYFVDSFNQIINNCDADTCTLPPETGYCRGYFPAYYFNAETKQCEKFIYGGCHGNANNFQTLEACENTCSTNICSLPADSGPCKAYIPRYFYNHITGTCESFIYGGCRGNDNNFQTLADCQQTCNQIETPDCVPKGGSFMGRPTQCFLMDFVCDIDEQHWFDVKCGCGCKPKATICAADVKLCPDGKLFVNRDPDNNCEFPACPICNQLQCLSEPCEFSWCDNYPDAKCTNNYCECNAIWTDLGGDDVTKKCRKQSTTTNKPSCVPDEWGFSGTPDFCAIAFIVCDMQNGFEFWSREGCGCGCKPKDEVISELECATGGCSGQVCAEKGKNMITTCEWKCEYGCVRLLQCGKGINGNDECGWFSLDDESERAYNKCMGACGGAVM